MYYYISSKCVPLLTKDAKNMSIIGTVGMTAAGAAKNKAAKKAAGQAAGKALDIGTGMGLNKWQNKQQVKQQDKLQKQQIEGLKEMGKFNQQLAMETWEKTNYAAQRKQLEKAGLNVGLMYQGSGQGGTTSGGTASGVSGATASGDGIS